MGDLDDLGEISKRLPPKMHTSFNDVYITRKTAIMAQMNICKDMLNKKSDVIVLHALGNAINRALNLALMLENSMKNSIKLDVITSSVTDDILNLFTDEGEFNSRQRVVSSIHIHVSRIKY